MSAEPSGLPRSSVRDEGAAANLRDAAAVSPADTPRREILPLVVADLTERIAVGTAEYGSALAIESPNDALRYAYEEALDLALYLRQELARRG